jgi:hypothetical protein
MVRFTSAKVQGQVALFMLLIAIPLLLASLAPHVGSQASSNAVDLSYQAFAQLASVYRSGGQAPDLVAKLNSALGMIQDARIRRAEGDLTDANKLEGAAASTLQVILAAIPRAQEEAARDSAIRTVSTVVLVPFVVALSTFIFYATLRTWRSYERMKLYEMRIVEKKTED